MKNLLCILIALPLLSQAQNIDSMAVCREVDSLIQLNRSLTEQRNFEEALRIIVTAENRVEQAFGKSHPRYATCLFNHGRTYDLSGQLADPEAYYLQALDIFEKTLGRENPDYALSIKNLAVLHMDMGNFEKAEPLYQEAKSVLEKALGKEHPDYAHTLSELARLFTEMGKFDLAEPLYVEAKTILENAFGKVHPGYASNLNLLAGLYLNLDKLEEAEELYLESNAIWEKVSGREHPNYANGLNDLGKLYAGMGNYDKAEPLFLEAWKIILKVLGKGHPNYATCLDNMVRLYWAKGNYDKIEPLLIEMSHVNRYLVRMRATHLSENELVKYAHKSDGQTDRLFSFTDLTAINLTTTGWNDVLLYKGFLLENARNLEKVIAGAPVSLREIHTRWKGCHRRLAAEYAKPAVERKYVAELENRADSLEKILVRSLTGFADARRVVMWQDVQLALQPGEAAIEFVHYRYYKNNSEPAESGAGTV